MPESARPSSTMGLTTERPRPMNRARSVSHSTAPPRRGPSTPSTWKPTIGDSSDRARTATEQKARALGIEFGLDEQLAKRRVSEIVLGTSQHDLGIAGHFDLTGLSAVVGDRQTPYFDVVLGRDGDLELGLDLSIAPAERDFVEIEDRIELVGLLTDWLVGGGPDPARPRIAHVDKVRPRVGGGVVAQPRDGDVAPHAEAAPGIRDRHAVATVREDVRVGARGMG